MATLACRVQFLDDTDPFNSTNFPEPSRPPLFTFREDLALGTQLAGVHRLLRAPHKLDDCTLQLSHNGAYLDLEATLAEQRDELEGFQDDAGRGKKHSIILRTQLSVRVHACIEKLYNSSGRDLRRALFSLKQIFQVPYQLMVMGMRVSLAMVKHLQRMTRIWCTNLWWLKV